MGRCIVRSMTTSPQRPRAVAYIRVSKVGARGEELKSPEYQLHEIQAHARRFGYELADVVEDIDKSGRDFRKRRVEEIVERIKAGEFQKVLLWKWSRWGRNTMENLQWLARVEDAGGEVEAATEHFDATTAYGEFSRTMILAMAQLQGRQIGDGWRDTHNYRRRAGLPHTSAPRFGYRYNRSAEPFPRYEKHEEEAELLKAAYEGFVAGTASFRSLSMEWNTKGVKNADGRPWSDATVRITMDTGFAAGLIRERSKQPKPGQPNSKRFAAFDIWREGSQEPIISNETWVVYRAMRIEASQKAPALRAPRFALSGMLFCAECGQTLKSSSSGPGGKWRQWVCRNGRDRRHPPVNVSDIRAMRAVREWLTAEAVGGGRVTEEAQRIVDRAASARTEIKGLKADLKKAKALRERLQESWLQGDFERSFYERRKAELDGRIETLTEQVAKASERDARAAERPTVEEFRALAEAWADWEPMYQRASLSKVVRGAVVSLDKGVRLVPGWE